MLQRREKLAVDRTESAAFTDLAANVEPKTWKMLSLIQFLNNITQLLLRTTFEGHSSIFFREIQKGKTEPESNSLHIFSMTDSMKSVH